MFQKRILLLVTFLVVLCETAMTFNSVLLPNLRGDFEVSDTLLQVTVAIALISLGVAGVIYGGLSESLGRRVLIIIGLCLFVSGSFLGAVSTSIEFLFLGRVLQGAGAGVTWIIGNAAIKDVFLNESYVVAMNRLHIFAGIVPAIAPIIGSYLAQAFGWRYCFMILSLLSFCILIINILYLPETIKEKKPASVKGFFEAYQSVISNSDTVKLTFCKVLCVSLIFLDGANLPLISIEHMGFSSNQYALYIGFAFLFYVAGSFTSERLCMNFELKKIINIGFICILISNLLIAIYSLVFNFDSVYPLFLLKLLSYLGFGFVYGNTTAAIVVSARKSAGAAAALMISNEMLCSGLAIYALSFFFDGSFLPISIYGAVVALAVMLCIRSVDYSKYSDKTINI